MVAELLCSLFVIRIQLHFYQLKNKYISCKVFCILVMLGWRHFANTDKQIVFVMRIKQGCWAVTLTNQSSSALAKEVQGCVYVQNIKVLIWVQYQYGKVRRPQICELVINVSLVMIADVNYSKIRGERLIILLPAVVQSHWHFYGNCVCIFTNQSRQNYTNIKRVK